MKPRKIVEGVDFIGVIDWSRRLFDSLIPLPDGTSYNAYLVRGADKTVLIDAVEEIFKGTLLDQLAEVKKLDYIVANHAEQDHSGAIGAVMEKYPEAVVLCTAKAKPMLVDHLDIADERIRAVADGETLDLGGRTLRFIHTPWVHWPETMCVLLEEDRILFSCDFFGSHVASTDMFSGDSPYVVEAAKRYYAEIMMPFRSVIRNNMKKLRELKFDIIAPSHGPAHDKPEIILSCYEEWISDRVANVAVIPYISMHGSTELMVSHLVSELASLGVKAEKFELTTTDIGKLAMALVDAATIVVGTPTVHVGPHPIVFNAVHLANAIRPKTKFAAVINSYGWASKAVEQIAAGIPNIKAEILGSVSCKGLPRKADYDAITALAEKIRDKHAALQAT